MAADDSFNTNVADSAPLAAWPEGRRKAGMRGFVRGAEWSLEAVVQSFAPPPTATSRAIRINGAVCIVVGLVCVAALGAGVLLRAPVSLLLIALFLAYAFLTVGGYRVIRGKETAARRPSGEISHARVLLGYLSVLFCVSLLIGMVLVVSVLLER